MAGRKLRFAGRSTMKADRQKGLDRRGFLKSLGGGAGAAALVAAGTTASPEIAEAAESDADKRKARYQANSAHVQAYYRTNRY